MMVEYISYIFFCINKVCRGCCFLAHTRRNIYCDKYQRLHKKKTIMLKVSYKISVNHTSELNVSLSQKVGSKH